MPESKYPFGDKEDAGTPSEGVFEASDMGGFEAKDLQGLAATIPYYNVTLAQFSAGGTKYTFGAAQNVTIQTRSSETDVRALGTTTMWMSYDVPDVSCTVTQNLGYGDPCPGLLGQDNVGMVTTQTTISNGDLPYYALDVTVGSFRAEMPRMRLDRVTISAAVGNFATAEWGFTGYNVRFTNNTAFTQTSWENPDLTTQAVFVKQGNVFANIAGVQHRVQNASITASLARDPLKQLGTHEPFASVPTLPVAVEATIEAWPVGQSSAQVISYYTAGIDPAIYARPSATSNATLIMFTPSGDGGHFGATAGHNKCTFTIPNASVTVLGLNGSTSAYGTLTYSLRGFNLLYKSETA
jgi:hypothetical protein